MELAEAVWKRVNPDKPFSYVSDDPFTYDVQKRVPNVTKAKTLLGYEATTSLDDILDIVTPWIIEQVEKGTI